MATCAGCLNGLPHADLSGEDLPKRLREPVCQIECLTDPKNRRARRDLEEWPDFQCEKFAQLGRSIVSICPELFGVDDPLDAGLDFVPADVPQLGGMQNADQFGAFGRDHLMMGVIQTAPNLGPAAACSFRQLPDQRSSGRFSDRGRGTGHIMDITDTTTGIKPLASTARPSTPSPNGSSTFRTGTTPPAAPSTGPGTATNSTTTSTGSCDEPVSEVS